MKERDCVLKAAIKNESSHKRQNVAMVRNKVELTKAQTDSFLSIIEKTRGQTKTIWDQLHKLMGDFNKPNLT